MRPKFKSFGGICCYYRRAAGLSIRDMTYLLDVGNSTYWKIETNRTEPAVGLAIQIMRILEAPLSELSELTRTRMKKPPAH